MKRVLMVMVMLAAAAAASAQAPARQAAPPAGTPGGDGAAGKRAFVEYACYYCHGTVGQGSLPNVGPRVARVPRSLESFKSYVRRPAGRMSSYPQAVISDAVLADIYTYLRGVPEPPRPLPPALAVLRKR